MLPSVEKSEAEHQLLPEEITGYGAPCGGQGPCAGSEA